MTQTIEGDGDMLEPLVRRPANQLLTFINRMIGDRQESEDVFQQVFLSVWTKRATFNRRYAFRPWLYQTGRNACLASIRRRQSRGSFATGIATDAIVAAVAGSPLDALVKSESAMLAERAVLRLAPRQRAVVVMRVWSELTYAQIAMALGVRESTVRAQMHQALQSLRRELDAASCDPNPPNVERHHE